MQAGQEDTRRVALRDGQLRAAGSCRKCLLLSGKKQDTWFIVDPKSGEKQTTLSTEAWDGLCPSSPLLYIGRTRKPALLPVRPPSPGSGCRAMSWCPALVPRVRHHHVRHQVTGAALERHLLRLLGAALRGVLPLQ